MISAPRTFALISAGAVAGAILAGCVQGSGTDSSLPVPEAASPSALAAAGRHEEAAVAWLAEAQGSAENAPTLELRAAEAWLQAGRSSRAAEIARAVNPDGLEPADRTRRSILLVRAALAAGAEEDAFDHLPPLADMLALPESTNTLELAARAAGQADRPVDEIRYRAALDPHLSRPASNRAAIWERLRALPDESLRTGFAPGPAAEAGQAPGWFELERLARAHRTDFAAFASALRTWRKRHPEHPAEASVLPNLVPAMRRDGSPPAHVALLLPLSGTFASAAAAIRDGFLAGWYEEGANRPLVSIHDTGASNPEEVFLAAVAMGADFVVGPLSKKAIARIAALPERGAPVLLLNALESDAVRHESGLPIYQFALSPEQEARAVAAHARRLGHARAGVLVPETEWGTRVADAFREHWESSGAVVAGEATYRGAAETLAEPVRSLLEIDPGQERARRLRRTLRRAVVHEPFPRGDLDFIFLAGFPREARLLRPQITFLRAPDLPIYATSHVFTGVPEPQHDLDLDGIVFNDMPWVLDTGTDAKNRLRERVFALWPAARDGFVRYYAFGADAYRLQGNLYRMAHRPGDVTLSGHTGTLSLGPAARLEIEMAWAQFRDGVPVPLTP